LHQEDFCQALGKPPSAKYEANQSGIPGPTLRDMFTLTRHAATAVDVLGMLDFVIFNVLACNTDAHAKNYSLLISGRGFRLAPLYDVMCAAAWPQVTRNLAQKIAGKNRGEHLKRRHWERFARECGLNPSRTVARVEAIARLTAAGAKAAVEEVEAMPAGSHTMLDQFRSAVEQRARAVLTGLDERAAVPVQAIAIEAGPPKAKPSRPRKTKDRKPRTARKKSVAAD
jgi:serine/threonine-protein kinase HipA